jgi:hypothetical protein
MVQLVINDVRLTLGDGGKMKLDTDPFPISMVKLMDKKDLVRTDEAETTKGKNMVVSNELRNGTIRPHNLRIGVWKRNVLQKLAKRVKLRSAMLIETYINGSWRKTGGTELPERSNRTDSSKPGTGRISGNHDVQRSPGGGWCSTLWIRLLR